MKKLFIALMFFVSSVSAEVYDWKVDKVLDGDTIKFMVEFLPAPLEPFLSVRVLGVDTPEKKPRNKCEKEDTLAQKASEYTKERVAHAHKISVNLKSWDKYGGRVLGDIFIDDANLAHELLENGLAREYHGETKSDWCN